MLYDLKSQCKRYSHSLTKAPHAKLHLEAFDSYMDSQKRLISVLLSDFSMNNFLDPHTLILSFPNLFGEKNLGITQEESLLKLSHYLHSCVTSLWSDEKLTIDQ